MKSHKNAIVAVSGAILFGTGGPLAGAITLLGFAIPAYIEQQTSVLIGLHMKQVLLNMRWVL